MIRREEGECDMGDIGREEGGRSMRWRISMIRIGVERNERG